MTTSQKLQTLNQKDYEFRFKRLPNYKTLENSYCSCCMLSFKRVYPDDKKEQGFKPIACYGCLQMSHKYCYGLDTLTKQEDEVQYFVCDVCKEGAKQHPTCQVCKNSGGLMRHLAEGGFIHPVCGFTHPQMNVINYSTLQFKKIPFYTDTFQACEICEKENAYFKCSQQKCNKRVHPFCVMKAYHQKEVVSEGDEVKDCWKFFMSAGQNKLYKQEDHSLEKEINDFVSEHKDNRINSELSRGGFQYVLCPDHSQHVFYCNCGMEIEDQMVFCDCCLQWYHSTCVTFKENDSTIFICPFCVTWFQLKDKILKEIKSNKVESYQLKLNKTPKLYVPDFILLAIICDFRLTKISQSGNNLAKIVKTIELYPLKLSRLPSQQKKVQVGENINFDEIQQWMTKNKQGKIPEVIQTRHVDDLWEGFQPQLKNSQKYIKTRINYLTTWTNVLRNLPQKVTISYTKIRGLLYEYYEILKRYMMVSSTIIKTLKDPIIFLEGLLEKILPVIQKLNKLNSIKEIDDISDNIGVIDISELLAEAKVFCPTRKVLILDVKIRKPYNDLNRFYQDYRRMNQTLVEDRIVFKEEKKEQIKRPLPTLQASLSDIKKKPKLQFNPISLAPSQMSTSQRKDKGMPNVVAQQDRSSIQKILNKRMQQNPQFGSIKMEQFARIIENQIFGEFHKNRSKYLSLSESFEMVFITLEQCPLISAKAKKKNFQYTFMKELVDNTARIKDIQQKLKLKQKDQQTNEVKPQATTSIVPPVVLPKNDVLKSIFSGKMEEKHEKELQEIYALKRQAQREKRLKHSSRHGYDDRDRGRDRDRDHRDRDKEKERDRRDKRDKNKRSRSKDKDKKRKKSQSDQEKDVQAKFSDSESQQVNKKYNPLSGPEEGEKEKDKDKQKQRQRDYLQQQLQFKNKTSNQPILYDPEEEEKPVEEKEKQYEKGTVLKLKTCSMEIYLNKEKKTFEGVMYTLEDSKKIKQLCDPNFQKISIKKDKPQKQILQYLSKTSRKKYRFLIGWVETNKVKDNEYLRDLAIECENKEKVFGLQNDFAKIHIMSSKQLNKEMINKFRAPNKVTTQQVAHYLNEHRIVFVLQFSIQKLYEIKSTSTAFSITPIFSAADVLSESVYTNQMLQPIPTMIPYGMDLMHPPGMMMGNPIDFRNEAYIETWDQDPIMQQPIKMRKQFSPITSQDQGPVNDREKKQQTQPASSGFDIMQILGKLDESDISKLTQQPAPSSKHQPHPSLSYSSMPVQQQRVQPSSYLYQHQRMPGMGNPHIVPRMPAGIPMQQHQYHQGYNNPPPHTHQMPMRGIPNQNMMQHPQRYGMPPNPNQGYYAGHIPPPPPPGGYHPPPS